MTALEALRAYQPPACGSVLTLGNFDGVHRGHQRLVQTARRRAREYGAVALAVTFDPHPLTLLAPQRAPATLMTIAERRWHLLRAGADEVLVLPTSRDLLELDAGQFVEEIVRCCRPRGFVEGPSFRFGRGRGGSNETLKSLAERHGYSVEVVDEWRSAPDAEPVSSSAIRVALSEGDVALAALGLGRPHRLTGVVESGQGRGGPLGFPTANLGRIPQSAPAHAVYAAVAQLADGALRPAAVNIGPQPTFSQEASRVEAHLIGFAGELRGAILGLHLASRLRGQIRFDGVEALRGQLQIDVQQAGAAAAPILSALSAVELPPL